MVRGKALSVRSDDRFLLPRRHLPAVAPVHLLGAGDEVHASLPINGVVANIVSLYLWALSIRLNVLALLIVPTPSLKER